MHGQGFFFQAFVYLAAAVVAVPIAKRLGLGSVLGYLIAGIVIGPFGLGLIGEEGQDVMHFAEFGVVMMLFLIGLELRPALLWRLRGPILGSGGLQVGLTTVRSHGHRNGRSGCPGRRPLAIGMTLALSSTAIVLQTLNEKGLMRTDAGQTSFAVLLFQDIAVIPMLALMPLLAVADRRRRMVPMLHARPRPEPSDDLGRGAPRLGADRGGPAGGGRHRGWRGATCCGRSFASSRVPACASCSPPRRSCWSSPSRS